MATNITADSLRARITLMEGLADAFDVTANFFAAQADTAYARQKRGEGLREITVHYLNSRDEHRRCSKTNREDAAISRELLARIAPESPPPEA